MIASTTFGSSFFPPLLNCPITYFSSSKCLAKSMSPELLPTMH